MRFRLLFLCLGARWGVHSSPGQLSPARAGRFSWRTVLYGFVFALILLGGFGAGPDPPGALLGAAAQSTVPGGATWLPLIYGEAPVDLDQPVTFGIAGLAYPNGLAVHRTNRRLYVTSRDTNLLFRLSPSGKVLNSAATGAQPWSVAVNETTRRVYVSNFGGGVWVYDADTLERLAVIDVGLRPGMLALNPATDTVAVVVTGESKIAFIQGLTLVQTVDTAGGGPYAIAADIRTNHFVVTHRDARTLGVYHKTDAGWRNDGAQVPFGDQVVPFGVTVDHRRGRIYVVTWHPGDEWFVEVFQKYSQGDVRPGAKIRVGNSGNKHDADVGGAGVAVNVNNQHVFVANTRDGTLSVVDGAIDAVVDTAPVGPDPTLVVMNRDSGGVYTALRSSNQIHRFRDQ